MKHSQPAAPLPSLIGGGITLSVAVLTRLTVGNPLTVLHQLGAYFLPPMWLMGLLWFASFALLGALAGHLVACPQGGLQREADLWRGGTFFVLSITLSLDWYTLLFGKILFLPACICLILSAAAALACAFSWIHVRRSAGIATLFFALWQILLLLLQVAVMLHT